MTTKAPAGFEQPQPVDDITLAFPADVREMMPDYDAIPAEFRNVNPPRNKWVQFQMDWFFGGLEDVEAKPNKGIDGETAWRHLQAIQRSFQPKHEHKMAAVAYLASLWFKEIKYKRIKK